MKRWCVLPATLPALLGAGDARHEQSARIHALEDMFLAPCCYSEPISRHRSAVALQMRAEIAQWVVEGRSDREIIDTYKQRYGARVLVEPEGAPWWWMHIVPWVVLLLGLAFTIRLMHRLSAPRTVRQAAASSGATSDEEWDS